METNKTKVSTVIEYRIFGAPETVWTFESNEKAVEFFIEKVSYVAEGRGGDKITELESAYEWLSSNEDSLEYSFSLHCTEVVYDENEKSGVDEVVEGNFKIVSDLKAKEPFVGVYFANGEGFDPLVTYLDKDGKLGIEYDGSESVLMHEENGSDFSLTGKSCWISVNNLSVYIKKDDEGVAVDIYPPNEYGVLEEPIASTWALYTEGESDKEG